MSFENPTRLRIGMSGNIGGKDYRIVGRAVLGEREGGGTYYWNEFKLENSAGEPATLVFDETEPASQWRLFTQFDPEYPMTAADAASKSVGDRLNLTGEDVRVTFRGASRVYYIEGQAPEGEEVGSVAEYFNALGANQMQVVSWTGEDVEYYNGLNLSPGMVASAFGLQYEPADARRRVLSSLSGSGAGNYLSGIKFAFTAGFILLFFLVIFGRGFSCSGDYEAGPVKKQPAPPAPLIVGATGALFGKPYRITTHEVVEIAEVGAKWDRHEYELSDEYGTKYLLVCGDRPGTGDWIFFEPLFPMQAPSAREAASKRIGDQVELDGFSCKVSEIFMSTIEQTDGGELGDWQRAAVSYDLFGTNESRVLLARWNDAGIQFFRGRALPPKQGAASFTAAK